MRLLREGVPGVGSSTPAELLGVETRQIYLFSTIRIKDVKICNPYTVYFLRLINTKTKITTRCLFRERDEEIVQFYALETKKKSRVEMRARSRNSFRIFPFVKTKLYRFWCCTK